MDRSNSLTQAALVLNRLPKKQAAIVLSRLEPDDIKKVVDAVARLDRESAEELALSLQRFESETKQHTKDPANNRVVEDSARKVDQPTRTSLKMAGKINRIDPAAPSSTAYSQPIDNDENPMQFLIDAHSAVRNHLVADEHPKNIAMVLSLLPAGKASECVRTLEPPVQASVFRRLCELDELHDEEILNLSFSIKMRMKKLLGSWYSTSAGMNVAAELLSCSDSTTQESVLEHMSQTDPDLAARLNRSVFRLTRLELLSGDEVKIVLRHVDTACWAPALKNSSLSLQKKILDCMGARPAELLRTEIDQLGHVSSVAQQQAEQKIVSQIIRLARDGKIDLRESSAAIPPPPVSFPKNFSYGFDPSTTSSIN